VPFAAQGKIKEGFDSAFGAATFLESDEESMLPVED
jgi:hypothetical protein